MYFLVYVIPALCITLWGYYATRNNSVWDKVTTKELVISVALNILIASGSLLFNQMYLVGTIADKYYSTGKVTEKYSKRVSCDHSYPCNCITICNGKTCSTSCSTCYHHSYDIDWVVKATNGSTLIDRINSQGTKEPPRWTNVKIGEPFTTTHYFDNYLLIDKDSLFVGIGEKNVIHKHPDIYDYYRYKPVISSPDIIKMLNEPVMEWLKDGKKISPLIYVRNGKNDKYFDEIMNTIDGGKLNTVVLAYELENSKVVGFNVGTYAKGYKNQYMISSVKNHVLNNPEFSVELVLTQLDEADKMFTLLSSTEFKDKEDMLVLPLWLTIIVLTLNIGSSIIVHRYMKDTVN